ncbi:MAG: hypothetical protein ACD_12C00021G0004, partial [uncultured bacterium]
SRYQKVGNETKFAGKEQAGLILTVSS